MINKNLVFFLVFFCRIVKAEWYQDFIQYNVHEVGTSDGFILQVHQLKSRAAKKDPILLWHGLSTTSESFLSLEDESLGFVLQQDGFDVWLGNSRGNTFSDKHVRLSKASREYWDFTHHEIGFYDAAATIDYILEKTQAESLHFVGHSQGVSVLLALLSMKPEYNDKIKQAHLIASAIFLERADNTFSTAFMNIINRAGFINYIPTKQILRRMCRLDKKKCPRIAYSIIGMTIQGSNSIPDLSEVSSERTGVKEFVHLLQNSEFGNFCMFDYGAVKNLEIYDSKIPPEYDLAKITASVFIYHGAKDTVVPLKGIEKLAEKLPNTKKLYLFEGLNHADLLNPLGALKVFEKMLKHLNEN